jgi:hypothetical protein
MAEVFKLSELTWNDVALHSASSTKSTGVSYGKLEFEAVASDLTVANFVKAMAEIPKASEPYTAVFDPDAYYQLLVWARMDQWLDMSFRIIPNEKAGRLEERWRRKQGRRK